MKLVKLRFRTRLALVMLLTMGVTVYLYVKVPKGFFPQQDTGRLQGGVQGQQHISFQAMKEKIKWFEEQVRSEGPEAGSSGLHEGSHRRGVLHRNGR